jgi:hypothetical protein
MMKKKVAPKHLGAGLPGASHDITALGSVNQRQEVEYPTKYYTAEAIAWLITVADSAVVSRLGVLYITQ